MYYLTNGISRYIRWRQWRHYRRVYRGVLNIYKMSVFMLTFFILSLSILVPKVYATANACVSKASGDWSAAGTWKSCGGGIPTDGDSVIITGTHLVTVDINTATISSLSVQAATATNGIVISGTNTLSVSGSITMQPPTAAVDSTISVGTGTLNAASIHIAGPNTSGHNTIVSVSTGTINLSGNITFAGNHSYAQLTFTGAGTLNIGGTISTGGTFIASTGTVNFNGTGTQIISKYTSNRYNNLTLSGSGTKIIDRSTIVSGNLVIGDNVTLDVTAALSVDGTTTVGGGTSGTLSFTSGTLNMSFTGLVTINPGASWIENTAIIAFFSGGITNNGTFTSNLGSYRFRTNNQTLHGTFSIPTIYITAPSLTNIGNLTISSAFHSSGSLINVGTLNLNFADTSDVSTLTATAVGNTVNYGHAGPQTVRTTNYHNLTLSNSGAKMLHPATSISGTLSIDGTAQALLSSGNYVTDQLLLNGTAMTTGTWGSSNSLPTPGNINNTYFALASGYSGYVTVNSGINPVATTTHISPSSVTAGAAGFSLTVNGTNFIPSSVVNFNGSARITTYVSPTELTVSIPASDLVSAGIYDITVTNPLPGGGISNAQLFTVYLVPTLAFTDNVEVGPVISDTVNASWGIASIKKWDYDADGICSTTASDYTMTNADSMNQTTEANNAKYICLYTEDAVGNKYTLASAHAINIDNVAPVITLLGDSTVNITVGSLYADAGATAWDNIDGNITSRIIATGPSINTSAPGTFVIHYNVSDTAGNHAVEVSRTVIVSSLLVVSTTYYHPTTSPVISGTTGLTITAPAGNDQPNSPQSPESAENSALFDIASEPVKLVQLDLALFIIISVIAGILIALSIILIKWQIRRQAIRRFMKEKIDATQIYKTKKHFKGGL